MSNENILFIIDFITVLYSNKSIVYAIFFFLVFLQGNICYHGNDKKTRTSQTFSFIL